MQRVAEVAPQLVEQLASVGARFTHHTSIAPTGTISLSLANNASNGIEPSFAHHYFRNVIREGKKSKEKVDVFSFELLAYREIVNSARDAWFHERRPRSCPITSPRRTTSRPASTWTSRPRAEVDRFLDLEDGERADGLQVRGVQGHLSVRLREGPEGLHHLPLQSRSLPGRAREGRRPQEHDLRVHARGRDRSLVKGDEEIEYDGEMHSAANLFDALKEGYYGKF
jgi:ribonucleoside-diphosphate reductase alpha chain